MAEPRSFRWYLMGLLGTTWRQGVGQARAMPALAWRRWVLVLLGGYAVSWGIAVLSVRLARGAVAEGLQAWDERLLEALADSGFSFPAGLWFEAWGSSAFLVPMLLVAMVLLVRGGWLLRALTLLVGYVATKGLVLGAWQLWNRARPELIADGIAAPGLHSFPSGHAVNAVVMFGLLGFFWWRASRSAVERALLVVIVTLVILVTSIGRVRIGTHWPSDLVGGFAIGIAWLSGLAVAVAAAERAQFPRND